MDERAEECVSALSLRGFGLQERLVRLWQPGERCRGLLRQKRSGRCFRAGASSYGSDGFGTWFIEFRQRSGCCTWTDVPVGQVWSVRLIRAFHAGRSKRPDLIRARGTACPPAIRQRMPAFMRCVTRRCSTASTTPEPIGDALFLQGVVAHAMAMLPEEGEFPRGLGPSPAQRRHREGGAAPGSPWRRHGDRDGGSRGTSRTSRAPRHGRTRFADVRKHARSRSPRFRATGSPGRSSCRRRHRR